MGKIGSGRWVAYFAELGHILQESEDLEDVIL